MAEDQEEQNAPESEGMKNLRRQAEEGIEAKRLAQEAQRELAFLRAGVDTETPIGKMFAKAYDGDLTVDAIKASALEVGIGAKASTPEVPTIPTEENQGAERRNLGAGSEPPGGAPDEDPQTAGLREFEKGMAEGMRREDAAAGYFGKVVQAALRGDDRALYRGNDG